MIHATVERIKQAQVPIIGETVAVPAAAITHAAGRKIVCYFLDPDGIL
jgi:hypothetical protein